MYPYDTRLPVFGLQVNGVHVGVGYVGPDQKYSIVNKGDFIRLETNFGLSVDSDGRWRNSIQIPSSYSEKVQGLCGNFDSNADNDHFIKDGNMKASFNDIGISWQVDDPCIPGLVTIDISTIILMMQFLHLSYVTPF